MKQEWYIAMGLGITFGLGLALGSSLEILQHKQKIVENPRDQSSQEKTLTYQLLDPMRASLPQEDFLVVFRPLRLELEKLASEWAERGVVVAIQLEYLNTGSYVSINQNYRMLPASLTKVPVAMMVVRRIEEGRLSFDQELEIKEEDRDGKWGEMYKLPVGTKFRVRQLIEKSLIESDNTAHKMLYRLVGVEDAQGLSQELNLEDLFDKDGKISAREYARLLRSLYASSYLKPENSELILDLLTQDQVVKFLIRGLGDGVLYAHKFGESAAIHSYLDAGIVYAPNRPYVLVVMVHDEEGRVKLTREQAGKEIFERVAKLTYEYVTEGKF